MALRLTEGIVRGELDNRQPGRVTGSLWLAGVDEPITLDLDGNFLQDMAGCLLTFFNPAPAPLEDLDIDMLQQGCVGDMTASKKVNVYDVTHEEAAALIKKNRAVPMHRANALFLEWFSPVNGRVVIESTHYDVRVSAPAWLMSEEAARQQMEFNREAFRTWLEDMGSLEDEHEAEVDELDECRPLNEFEWEQVMRETDRRAEKLDEVLAKYEGHPESEKLIAREMGWTWLEDELEAQERGIMTFSEPDEEMNDEIELPEPNPLTHGINWVRDENGNVCHPLALLAAQISLRLGRYLESAHAASDTVAQSAQEMELYMQLTAAKLAGVLNHLAYDEVEIDNGFVVAGLKRALHLLHKTIHVGASSGVKKMIDPSTRRQFQKELFTLRESIIDTMNSYRNKDS